MPDFEDLYPDIRHQLVDADYVDNDSKPCRPVACPPFEEITLTVDPEPVRPGEFGIAAYHQLHGTVPPMDVDPRHVMIAPMPFPYLDEPLYPRSPQEAARYAYERRANFVYGGPDGVIPEFENETVMWMIEQGWADDPR